ncbi:MAG: recombinase family protein [Ruminococcaceae bacterium]|nr:recombinase family protein [Oscillospiraceae bacterium]
MYHNYIEELNLQPDEVLDYLRKSRADDPLLTVEEVLARHESILDEWAEKNLGAKVPEENKFREVVSGETIADRPEIQKVLRLIESPRIKAVLIVEVQRLSRGDLEDCGRLIKLLRYTNTLVITPQKTYDLRDEYDRDMFERELKRGNEFLEYTKKIMSRGKLRSISEGNYVGSTPPYGYNRTWVTEGKRKCPTLAINEEQANVVRMIFDMYVYKDMGMPSIAKRLDELGIKPPKGEHWSKESLKDMLTNVHYIGKVKWNWRKTITVVEDSELYKTRPKSNVEEHLTYDGKHEAIISLELFDKAQKKQGRNHKTKGATKVRNPLASLIWCHCGRAMSLRVHTHRNGEWRLACTDQTHCHTGSCTYEEMEDMVVDILKQCISDFEIRIKNNNGDAMKMHEKLLKTLEKKMQDLEAKELAQWEAQSDPDPSQRMPPEIFKRLNEKLLKEKEEVKEAMCNARKSMPDPIDYEEKLGRFKDALDALLDPEVDAQKKNRLLKACIDRIVYHREAPVRSKRKPGEKRGTTFKTAGGHWDTSPIELDVKLRV